MKRYDVKEIMMKSFFGQLFGKNTIEHTEIQIFTYFIPSPNPRKSGYREKELDSLFEQLIQKGFEIIELKTQSLSCEKQSGMWVIAKLRPITNEAKALKVKDFPNEFVPQEEKIAEEQIEGIYYID